MRPMLAATLDTLEDARFPLYASAKLDGIRCLMVDGMPVSRALKPIPNKYITHQLRLHGVTGLDGELMIEGKDFNEIQSAVMSEDWEGEFEYCVFDNVNNTTPFSERYAYLTTTLYNSQSMESPITVLEQYYITNLKDLLKLEEELVNDGYEGVMLREPHGMYKFGRSTLREGCLLKFKRFKDSEAFIIGFEELQHNNNEKTTDALGHSQRSSHKSGYIPAATLGSLWLYDEKLNVEFNVGTGFTQEQRDEIWKNQKKYEPMLVTYTYQELSSKGVPRFPSFKGFRDIKDMDNALGV